jgi:hypothetical protein
MRLFALTVATATVVAFAIPQIPQVLLAQGPDTQSGASAQGSDTQSGASAQHKKSQTGVGISAKSREATTRGRTQARIGVKSGSRADVIVKRKRARGVVVLNDEPRRHVVIKRRHPGVAITTGDTSRTPVRSRVSRDMNVGARALAAPYYYGEPPYYYSYGEPYYPEAAYGPGYYRASGNGGDASYCASRYRSYDPATGTYLGYDGARHPCP